MNRYTPWKYIVIAVVLLIGVLYTLPNFFADVPAVQVSSLKSKVDTALLHYYFDTKRGLFDAVFARRAEIVNR